MNVVLLADIQIKKLFNRNLEIYNKTKYANVCQIFNIREFQIMLYNQLLKGSHVNKGQFTIIGVI